MNKPSCMKDDIERKYDVLVKQIIEKVYKVLLINVCQVESGGKPPVKAEGEEPVPVETTPPEPMEVNTRNKNKNKIKTRNMISLFFILLFFDGTNFSASCNYWVQIRMVLAPNCSIEIQYTRKVQAALIN